MSLERDRNATDITIFGHKFTLRGPSDPDVMRTLAARVDERMRELAKPKPGEPIHRVAILTALVLMDELSRKERALESERKALEAASRAAAQLDLRLQALLHETPPLDVEPLRMDEQPEVLDLGGWSDPPVQPPDSSER